MWMNHMLSFWPFVLIYAYIAVILGLVVLRQLKSWAAAARLSRLARPRIFSIFTLNFSLLSHLGLFLAMTTATLGNADVQRLKMMTVKGEPTCWAVSQQNIMVQLPFTIELKDFILETYDDESPKRFASAILITPRNTAFASGMEATVEVNKPVEVEGWKIYQYGYDTQMGAMSQISILELVSDPWLPFVYTGIYLMMGGAVCMFVFGGRKRQSGINQ